MAGALAFFMGWQYEKGYLEAWGLSFSAFSYAPHELMVASSAVLLSALVVPLGALMVFLTIPFVEQLEARTPRAAPASNRARIIVTSAIVAPMIVVVIISRLRGDFESAMLLMLALFMTAAIVLLSARTTPARLAASALGVISIYLVVIAFPENIGSQHAKDDMQSLQNLPRIELTLERPLGANPERFEAEFIRSGPWRLLRVNDGHLWLVPDVKGATDVTQLSQTDLTVITYLPDREPAEPTPTQAATATPAPP